METKLNLYSDNSGGIWLDCGKDTVRIIAQQRPIPEAGYGKVEYELYNNSDCYELKRGYVELTWGPLEVFPINDDAISQGGTIAVQ